METSAKKLILPLIKNTNFSSCETDFSRRSSLTIENYDVLTIWLRLWQVLTHLEASLVVEVEVEVEVESRSRSRNRRVVEKI